MGYGSSFDQIDKSDIMHCVKCECWW